METLSGIEFIHVLQKRPKIILTTAYTEYALKAFDLDVSDYLLKPISFERFIQATEKVYNHFLDKQTGNTNELQSTKDERDYFFVKTEFRVERIDFNDIMYIEGLKEALSVALMANSTLNIGAAALLQKVKNLLV